MNSPPAKRRRQSNDGQIGMSPSSKLEKLSPVVVFAHGAGAPSSSDWMIRWKDMLREALHAAEVVTFDYPYVSGGKRRTPPKAEKLVEFHLGILKKTAAKYPGHPLILAGKSMGSRHVVFFSVDLCYQDTLPGGISCLRYFIAELAAWWLA